MHHRDARRRWRIVPGRRGAESSRLYARGTVSARARWYMRRAGALVGAIALAGLVAIAVIGPRLSSHDPLARDIDHGLSEVGAPLPPSPQWPLGTDQLGRDVWARAMAAASTSLTIAAFATLLALAIGVAIGLSAASVGGWIDSALMRFVDLVLAFPVILVAIVLAALLRETRLSSSILRVALTLGLIGWTTPARIVRGKARGLVQSDFVAAARALGATPWRIATAHVLPNLGGVLTAMVALLFAQNLLAESALSYLGLGPPPPAPSWGRMLFEGRAYYRTAPWLVAVPGAAIVIAVISVNVLSEALRASNDVQRRV